MTQLLEIMETSRKYMEEGDLPVAYELVTEAAQLVVQMEVLPWTVPSDEIHVVI